MIQYVLGNVVMPIIDISDWEKEDYFVGTRRKLLYTNPRTREKAFFKYPYLDPRTGEELPGEIWSEKIAADIGDIIGVPTPKVDLANNEEGFGSLSYNFLKQGEELIHGADFLSKFFEFRISLNVVGEDFDPRNPRHHKLLYVLKIIESIKSSLVYDFINILIFDALIGNTDRHSENWGIIKTNLKDAPRARVAPAFDNGSSLGREFKTDEERISLLNDEKRLEKYIFGNKATACISFKDKKRVNHFELITILISIGGDTVRKLLKQVARLRDDKIDRVLSSVPNEIMTEVSKEMVKKILMIRRNELFNLRRW